MSSSTDDTSYGERFSIALARGEPDLNELRALVKASYTQEELKKLTVAARKAEWREALRGAGFLAAVADGLTSSIRIDVAHESIRFLTNELAYSDEGRLLMLQAGRISKLAHWLQAGVTAQTTCLAFHNLFNTDVEEEDDEDCADRSVTYQTRCSAIAQGAMRIFCQITFERAREDVPRKWDDWATMCSYLLECATDHRGEQLTGPPALSLTESLITGFEQFDLLAPPAERGCRCANSDQSMLRLLCNLLAAAGTLIEHPTPFMYKIDSGYAKAEIVEILQDNSSAAGELFNSILSYLSAQKQELSRHPERLNYLIDAHNTMVRDIHSNYERALRSRSRERFPNTLSDLNDRLRPRRHQLSDLIGDIVQAMKIADNAALRSNPVLLTAVCGLGDFYQEVQELACLIVGNIANSESVATALVEEYQIHFTMFRTGHFRENQPDELIYAASGLLRNLAIPEHQHELIASDGSLDLPKHPMYNALDTLLTHRSGLIQMNGLSILRLLCRSFKEVAWLMLGIEVTDGSVTSRPQKFTIDHLLSTTPSASMQTMAAKVATDIYKHLHTACKSGLGSELKVHKSTHSLETPLHLGNMLNVCKMQTNDAGGVWLGLALITTYSIESAHAVYDALALEWEFFSKVATGSQDTPDAPRSFTHSQTLVKPNGTALIASSGEQESREIVAKYNAAVIQVTSARNALFLASSLRSQLGTEIRPDHKAALDIWMQDHGRHQEALDWSPANV